MLDFKLAAVKAEDENEWNRSAIMTAHLMNMWTKKKVDPSKLWSRKKDKAKEKETKKKRDLKQERKWLEEGEL